MTTRFSLSKGYSLIEMMVVLGIMGILFSMGIASYNSINDRSKIEQAAVNVATKLRDWQKQTDAGVGSDLCAPGEFEGREITFDSMSGIFHSRVVCNGVYSNDDEYVIMNGAVVSDFTSFIFLPLSQGTSVSSVFTVSNNAATVNYQVIVDAGGSVGTAKKDP